MQAFFIDMIKLFKLDDYEVTVEPEALLLKPFKTIWDRDKSKDKSLAKQERTMPSSFSIQVMVLPGILTHTTAT
jgi:hypothetical protein